MSRPEIKDIGEQQELVAPGMPTLAAKPLPAENELSSLWAPKHGVLRFTYESNATGKIVSFKVRDLDSHAVLIYKYRYTEVLGKGAFGISAHFISDSVTELTQSDDSTVLPVVSKAEMPEELVIKKQKIKDSEYSGAAIYNEAICRLEQDTFVGFFGDEKSNKKAHMLATVFRPGETLYKFAKENKIRDFAHFLQIVSAVVNATNKFQEKGWVHRDAHLKNMIIREPSKGKIEVDLIDYGLSVPKSEKIKDLIEIGYTPSVRDMTLPSTPEIDVLYLGRILQVIYNEKFRTEPDDELNKLFNKMADKDPSNRPNLLDVQQQIAFIEKNIAHTPALKPVKQKKDHHPEAKDTPIEFDIKSSAHLERKEGPKQESKRESVHSGGQPSSEQSSAPSSGPSSVHSSAQNSKPRSEHGPVVHSSEQGSDRQKSKDRDAKISLSRSTVNIFRKVNKEPSVSTMNVEHKSDHQKSKDKDGAILFTEVDDTIFGVENPKKQESTPVAAIKQTDQSKSKDKDKDKDKDGAILFTEVNDAIFGV